MATPRPQEILAHVGGRAWLRYGGSRRRRYRTEHGPPTVARSTVGTTIGRDGLLHTAAVDTPRLWWLDLDGDGIYDAVGVALEGARTNSFWPSEDFTHANWVQSGVTVSANATTGPDGTVSADKVVEDASLGAVHHVRQSIAGATDSAPQSFLFAVKAAERTWALARTVDKAGTGKESYFNLSTGAWATVSTSHVVLPPWKLANGWYVLPVTLLNVGTGVSTPFGEIGPTTGDGVVVYDGSVGSGIFVGASQWEKDAPFPSSYIKTLTAAVARGADTMPFPIGYGPPPAGVAYTSYMKVVPFWPGGTLVTPSSSAHGMGSIGIVTPFTADGKTTWDIANRRYDGGNVNSRVNANNVTIQTQVALPSSLVPLRMLSRIEPVGTDHRLYFEFGGGGNATTGTLTIGGFPWREQTMRPNERGNGADPGFAILVDWLVARGSFTLAEMEAY